VNIWRLVVIKEVLQGLSSDDRGQLMYGFENGFSQIIELEDGLFIGVHISNVNDYEILEQKGVWYYGKTRR